MCKAPLYEVSCVLAMAAILSCTPPERLVLADESAQVPVKVQTDSDSKKAEPLRDAAKKIKQLQKAVENGSHKESATRVPDPKKKALLSWRVHLLPFLEEKPLYEQFHLDEPWDSEHNKKLIEKIPPIYRTSSADVGKGKTTFLAPVSKHSVITKNSRRIRFADIRDGASKTILFVQAKPECAVIWTKPQDIEFDPKRPMRCLDSKAGFLAVFCDGSIHRIPPDVDHNTLRRLVDRRDGEPVTTNF